MKFRVIDGWENNFEDIYTDFENEYLNSPVTNDELRKKYGLSKRDFSRLCHTIKSKNGLSKRPSRSKYYYKNKQGFNLVKKVNGKIQYGGWIPTSKQYLLQEAVEICERLQWNTEKCRKAIAELKQCN